MNSWAKEVAEGAGCVLGGVFTLAVIGAEAWLLVTHRIAGLVVVVLFFGGAWLAGERIAQKNKRLNPDIAGLSAAELKSEKRRVSKALEAAWLKWAKVGETTEAFKAIEELGVRLEAIEDQLANSKEDDVDRGDTA